MEIDVCKKPESYMHGGRAADISTEGKVIGSLFEVDRSICRKFDLPGRCAAAIINVTKLLELPIHAKVAITVPPYPPVVYDQTVTMNHSKKVGDILSKVRESSELLESAEIADLYTGSSLKSSEYNLTLRCTYRAKDRTLTEDEAKKEFSKVEKILSN